jgi:hypothetical protein
MVKELYNLSTEMEGYINIYKIICKGVIEGVTKRAHDKYV